MWKRRHPESFPNQAFQDLALRRRVIYSVIHTPKVGCTGSKVTVFRNFRALNHIIYPRPQFDGLGEADTKLSDHKCTKCWTLEPILTPERFIRFSQIWLENDCSGFSFKIDHHWWVSYVYNDQNNNAYSEKKQKSKYTLNLTTLGLNLLYPDPDNRPLAV